MSLCAPVLVPIWVPILAGIGVAFLPRRGAAAAPSRVIAEIAAIAVTILAAVWGVLIWAAPEVLGSVEPVTFSASGGVLFNADALSGFAGAAVGVLALVMTIYAVGFSREKGSNALRLYSGILLAVGVAFGSLYAESLVVLAIFGGLLALPGFLVMGAAPDGGGAGRKALFIAVIAEVLLVLGIVLLWSASDRPLTFGGGPLLAQTPLLVTTYVCFLAAALVKAGVIPVPSWIAKTSAEGPVPGVALLPAAIEKILGIYLLARVSFVLFTLTPSLRVLVMVLGVVIILVAVFMALVQHDLRKLLGFHAVSQVGYMVLGIGTGTFVGIAGGLFHMLNNVLYKPCLFLAAGGAERACGTRDIGKMGGLAKVLPISFAAASIAALADAGVPPFNGFASKWMIYTGLVEGGKSGGFLWVFLLAGAVLGSVLTLASMVKVIYGIYLAPPSSEAPPRDSSRGGSENLLTCVPMVLLAGACVVFGVAMFRLPLGRAIFPAVTEGLAVVQAPLPGFWQPSLATGLLLAGLAVGTLLYLIGTVGRARVDAPYIGGEDSSGFDFRATDFYETLMRLPPLSWFCRKAAPCCSGTGGENDEKT